LSKLLDNLSTDDLKKKINSLFIEIQAITAVSDEEIEDFKKILELTDFSEE
tara:strand:+ start:157 stop:309 length:153 start_codon:yes stop_codon:yes gene_type:complete